MKKALLFLGFFWIIVIHLTGQETPILHSLDKNLVRENVVCFTDRELYLSGETIFFDAIYSLEGLPPDEELSKILYVELFNPAGEKITQGKYNIINNKVHGTLKIPEQVLSSSYLLRVYTLYQRNQPVENYFTSLLTVINPNLPLPSPPVNTEDTIQIGISTGMLVAGQPNRIAMKVNASLNNNISNIVLSDSLKMYCDTVRLHENGLGIQTLNPVDSSRYYLKIYFNNGDSLIKILPLFDKPKLNITSAQSSKYFHFQFLNIEKSIDLSKDCFLQFYSLQGNKSFEIKLEKWNASLIDLPVDEFDMGIYYSRLVDNNDDVLADHFFFHFPETKKNIYFHSDKKYYGQREKVTISFDDPQLLKYSDRLNIAVVKQGAIRNSGKSLPEFLIYNPQLFKSYSYTHPDFDNNLREQVEACLLLNRKNLLKWATKCMTSLKRDTIDWLPEINDLSLSGYVRLKSNNQPLEGAVVYLSVLGKAPQIHLNRSDKEGRFLFTVNDFVGQKDLYLSTRAAGNDEPMIRVINNYSNEYPMYNTLGLQVDTTDKKLIEEMWRNKQVSEYLVPDETVDTNKIEKSIRFGEPDISINTADFIPLTGFDELIKELVPFVTLKKQNDNNLLEVFNPRNMVIYENPLVLIDDIPIHNLNNLSKLPYPDIEGVDVYNNLYIYGDNVFNGIVSIRTITDDFGGVQLPYGSVFLSFSATQKDSKIVYPDYYQSITKESPRPDFRNLLFKKEEIFSTNQNNEISFFTGDENTSYDIILYGTDKQGRPVFSKSIITVTIPE